MSDYKELLENLRDIEQNDQYVMTMSFGPYISEAIVAIEAFVEKNDRLNVLVKFATLILQTFEQDEAQGYRSKARQYAISLLRPALAALEGK